MELELRNLYGVGRNPVRNTITIGRSATVLTQEEAVNLAVHLVHHMDDPKAFTKALKVLQAEKDAGPKASSKG